jgi:CHAT domain-containing protein
LSARASELDRRLLAALAKSDQEEITRLRSEMGILSSQLSAADKALRKAYPDYADLISPRALPVAEAQARLGGEDGLLFIVPSGADVYSFGLSESGIAWNRQVNGLAPMLERIHTLRCQVDPATCGKAVGGAILDKGATPNSAFLADGFPVYDRDSAYLLYRNLVAPVESAFVGKKRLYVTVTGALGGLPLSVLLTKPPAAGEDGADPDVLKRSDWLGERYAMTALPSVSVLRAIKRAERTRSPDAAVFIGYGAPRLDGLNQQAVVTKARLFASVDEKGLALANPATLRALVPLPGTERELAAMAAALHVPTTAVQIGDKATETAVRADLGLSTARIIAFATHGILPREISGVEEPGLVFTPPVTPTSGDDGLLAASEVARLSLSADWVLLSACNTASSDGTPGADSLSSLARSFLYAGASALLASHWRVSDDATAALTVETLAARGRGSAVTRSQALQAAMRVVRTGKHEDGSPVAGYDPVWAHPSAWGAFTVISNEDR